MKKTILILAMTFAIGFTFTSCKKDKKEEVKTEVNEEMASNVLYQCPMDCEHGKSYTEAGNCPKCNMALKEKKFDKEGNELCVKCGKTKAECAKEHADGKMCEKCGNDKGECTCPKHETEKDSTNHEGHNH